MNNGVQAFQPNWITRIGHVVILIIACIAIPGMIILIATEDYERFPWPILVLTFLLLIAARTARRILFYHPSALRVDHNHRSIKFSTLSRSTQVSDIKGYSSGKSYRGRYVQEERPLILLYLKDDRVFEINGFAIRNINDFVPVLRSMEIPYLGPEESSWYPFVKRRYKYNT